MPLERQSVSIPFSGGIDTKTDQKAVVPGELVTLENGIFTKLNKIEKRGGYRAFTDTTYTGSTTSTYANAQGIAPFRDELLLFADASVFSLNEQNDSWINKGHAQSVKNEVFGIKSNGVYDSFAKNDQIGVISGYNGSSVDFYVIDTNTKALVLSQNVTGSFPAQTIACGEYIFIFVQATNNLNIYRISKNAPNVVDSNLALFTNLNGTKSYLTVNVYGSNMVVSYKDTSNNYKLLYVKQDMEVGSPTNGLPAAITVTTTYTASNHFVSSYGYIYTFYSDGGGPDLKYKVYDTAFNSLAGPTTIKASVTSTAQSFHAVEYSASEVYVYWTTNAGGSALNNIERALVKNDGTVTTAWAVRWLNANIIGNPVIWDNDHYLLLKLNSTVQPTIYMVDSAGDVASMFLPGIAAPRTDYAWPLVIDSDKLWFTSREITELAPIVGGSDSYLTNIVTCDFNPLENFYTKEANDTLYISGGLNQIYDGIGVFENGFLHYPEYTISNSGAGGTLAAGTYQVYVIWEWIDNKGNIHRSSPGVQQSTTTGGATSSIPVVIKNLHYTEHGGNAVIYSTLANGTIPYRVTSVATSASTEYINYTITAAPNTGNEILYTTGNVLENNTPPPARIIEVYKDRLVLAGLENVNQIWISKPIRPGEAVSFNEAYVKNVNPLGGPIKSLKFMDEKLLIFKDNLIFAMTGDGGNDLGQNDSTTQPELISSDVGCPYPNSVVLTPMGVMFKSYKGIYLIDRTLNVTYVGSKVEDYNSLTTVSADLIQDKNQIRFIHTDGVCLVYDYFWQKWSTFTNHLAIDAHIWQGKYVYIRQADSIVYYSDDTHYQDNNVGYALKLGTSWLKFAGLQGFQRVKRMACLGEFRSAHTLQVEVSYDYEQYVTDTILFAAGSIISTSTYGDDVTYGDSDYFGGEDNGVYQFRAHLARQKCQAIKFVFSDVSGLGNGQGYSLTDLSLEVGIKKGLNKLSSSKTL